MKIELLKVFTAVCETQSFTTASHVLGLPKASVSASVQKLESELGVQLFHRTTRKVTITHDGAAFYEKAKSLLSDLEEARTMFQIHEQELIGKVRVDLPVKLAKKFIIPRLGEFFKNNPRFELELSTTDRRVDLIKEGFDFVVRVGDLTDSGLIARKIGEYQVGNFVSPSYIERFGTPKNLQDLRSHHQIHYESVFGQHRDGFEYHNGEKYITLKTKSLIIVNSTDAYLDACLAGLGIIQSPVSGAEDLLKTGELKRVLTKFKARPMPISLVYPEKRNMSRRVRAFMNWVEKQIKEQLT